MWYVYYFDSEIYSSEFKVFETEKLAMEFMSNLVNRDERLVDIKFLRH